MIKTIERLQAVMTVIVAVLVLSACSGDNGENTQEFGEGSGSSVEVGGSAPVATGGSSGSVSRGGSSISAGSTTNSAGHGSVTSTGSTGQGAEAGEPAQAGTSSEGGTNGVGGDPQVEAGSSPGGSGNVAGTSSGGTSASGGAASAGSSPGGSSPGGSSPGGSGNVAGTSSGGTSASGGAASAGSSPGGSSPGGSSPGGSGNVAGTSSGGTSASGGSTGSSGSSGSAGSAGSAGSGGGPVDPPVKQPFSYGTPARDTSFPTGWDLTHRAWASGPSDVYVPVSKVDASAPGGYVSAIAHLGASGWSLELNGVYVWCKEVSGADANNVYAACVKYEDYFYKGVLVRRIGSNNWQEVKMLGLTRPDITSLWCASASDCFAVVQTCQDATHCAPVIWRGSGTTWNAMSVPAVTNGTGRRVRCISPGDCYVIGEEGPKAFLWRLVGSSWKVVTTLPSDVTYLWDLSGTSDELVVVGQAQDAGVKTGIRLTSDDLVGWDRDESSETAVESAVWVPWNGSALFAGTVEDENGLQYPGDARVCGKSLGLSAEEASIDGTLLGVTSIIPISDDTALITAYGSVDAHVASVYVVAY